MQDCPITHRDGQIQHPNASLPIRDLEHCMSYMENIGGERLIRLPEVQAKVGLGRSEIYRRMGIDAFPASRSLGPRCVVWVESEIDEWVRAIVRQGC